MTHESEAPRTRETLPATDGGADIKAVVAMFCLYGVDFVLTGAAAQRPWLITQAVEAPASAEVLVAGNADNLEKVAESLFALDARRVSDLPTWNAWPSTVENLEGAFVTTAGVVNIEAPSGFAAARRASTKVRLGGETVRLDTQGRKVAMSEPTAERLADQL